MSDRRYRDEDWLREQYVVEGRSTPEIASDCGCSASTIWSWLDRFGINTRSRQPVSDSRLENADWLREQYELKRQTRSGIADVCGCASSTVSYWLEQHGIEIRPANQKTDPRLEDSEWLHKQYVVNELTQLEIAEMCDCALATVSRRLDENGVEARVISGENHPLWGGGRPIYGPGWNERKRRRVRERDGRICQDPRCSVTQEQHREQYGQRLHVHHLRKARDVTEPEQRNAMENLITLCRDCHKRWEKVADAGLVPEVVADD